MLSSQPVGLVQRGGRLDNVFDQDEGRFVADGLVPGLRANVATRRDNPGMIPNHLEDPMQINPVRLQQARNLEHLYPTSNHQFINQGSGAGLGVGVGGGRNAIPTGFQPPLPTYRGKIGRAHV